MCLFQQYPELLRLYLTDDEQVDPLVEEALTTYAAGSLRRLLVGGFSIRSEGASVRVAGIRDPRELLWAERCAFAYVLTRRVRDSYDPARPFLPWFLTITRHLLIDAHRAASGRDALPGDEALHALVEASSVNDAFTPELAALERERAEQIARATTLLEPREREVFELRHRTGLRLREVAERTGLSISKILTSERRIAAVFAAELGLELCEGSP